MTPAFLTRAVFKPKGHRYEDFEIGRRFEHHWGRTINHGDNSLFRSQQRRICRGAWPSRCRGSFRGGDAFLGVEELSFAAPVIVTEALSIGNMTKGTVDKPGKNVKRKAGLNRAILDAAPGRLSMSCASKCKKLEAR